MIGLYLYGFAVRHRLGWASWDIPYLVVAAQTAADRIARGERSEIDDALDEAYAGRGNKGVVR